MVLGKNMYNSRSVARLAIGQYVIELSPNGTNRMGRRLRLQGDVMQAFTAELCGEPGRYWLMEVVEVGGGVRKF